MRKKIITGFSVAIATLLVFGWFSYDSILRMRESSQWVQHTFEVIAHIHQIDADIHQAQAGFRGYLVLQNPIFLRLTEAGLQQMREDASATGRLFSDNPKQVENFKRLAPFLTQAYALGQERIKLCATGHVKEARAIFQRGDVIPRNATIEDILHQMIDEEQSLLTVRQVKEAAHNRDTLLILFVGGFFSVLFLGTALFIVNEEILEREKMQKHLQLDEYRLFQYLEAIPLGILVTDKNGTPYYANRQVKEILGKGVVPQASSKDLAEVYQAYRAGTQELYPIDQMAVPRALKGEKVTFEDLEIHRPDGTIIPLQVWGTPVFNQAGEIQYAMAVMSDISERKQVEEMKHSLISIVSHQLKTPVGEINGYIENLLEGVAGELGERQRDYLLDMREIGLDNFRLISDLLNISKIERGLLGVNLQKYSLQEMVRLSLRDYEKIIERKGLTLTREGFDQTLEVIADQDKLMETLRNLVNNAIKFTDKGGITLKAEVAGTSILLSIQDTGMGISEASMAQLFTRKRVLGAEASRAGAGLGLYVARYFMKLQNGDISVTTEAGKGSCFTLTIPRAPSL